MSEVLSPTMIRVAWKEIPPIDRNGIVTNYEVLYEPLRDDLTAESVNTTDVFLILVELEEFVHYSISVRAYTSVGPGPYSISITNQTEEHGKVTTAWLPNIAYHLNFLLVICSTWPCGSTSRSQRI